MNKLVKNALLILGTVLSSESALAQSNKPVIAFAAITSLIADFNTLSIQLALENASIKTNKFTTMERTRLATLMEEQGLTREGIESGSAQIQGFSGVDYLVLGTVTNITVDVLNCDATLSIDLRVVDISTGGNWWMSETLPAEIGTVAEGDPCSGMTLSSINVIGEEGADGIANKMTMEIFPIKVARVTDAGEVYLNYGEGTLEKGSVLTLKKTSDGFLDPDSGVFLGFEEITSGVIVVNDVRPAFSIGNLVVSNVPVANVPVAVGDVAYPWQAITSTERLIRRCVASQEKRIEVCEKDSGGRACTSQVTEVEKSCGALMDL